MSAPVFLDAAGVAELIGLPDAGAFLRRRVALEDRTQFPLPLPHWRRPLKYRRDQVLAWLDRQGRPADDGDPVAEAIAAGMASGKVALLDLARVP